MVKEFKEIEEVQLKALEDTFKNLAYGSLEKSLQRIPFAIAEQIGRGEITLANAFEYIFNLRNLDLSECLLERRKKKLIERIGSRYPVVFNQKDKIFGEAIFDFLGQANEMQELRVGGKMVLSQSRYRHITGTASDHLSLLRASLRNEDYKDRLFFTEGGRPELKRQIKRKMLLPFIISPEESLEIIVGLPTYIEGYVSSKYSFSKTGRIIYPV